MDISTILFSIQKSEIFSNFNIFLIGIGIFWMIISSIQDFKRREVENWWNFSFIAFVLVFRAFLSVQTWNYMYFVWGIIGLIVGFILANAFYYARIFAGGDAKLLMALCTVLPLSLSWNVNLYLLILFLIFFVVSGSIYGVIYSLFLTIFNYKRLKVEFSKYFKKYKRLIYYIDCALLLVILIFIFFKFYMGIALCIVLMFSSFLLIFAKSVESCCMERLVAVSDLTIGDWTIKSIKAGKRLIKPNWEGLNENELKVIQKYCRGKVLVKQGIPFVPVFLITFSAMILFIRYFIN
jgi:Flp pilus assembly protein protease CpaA